MAVGAARLNLSRLRNEGGGVSAWTAITVSGLLPMIFLVAAVSENLEHHKRVDAAADAAAQAAGEAVVSENPSYWDDLSRGSSRASAVTAAAAVLAEREGLYGWTSAAVNLGAEGGRLTAQVEVTYRSRIVFWIGDRTLASTGTARFSSAVAE